jgi:membrane-associated protease RseP (regulator of RpoE activity)
LLEKKMLQYCGILGLELLMCILMHELGHLLAARWLRVKSIYLSIGFGPELIGFTDRLGTRWRLAAIPIGGSVGIDTSVSGAIQNKIGGRGAESSIQQRAALYAAGPVFSFVFGGAVLGLCILISDGIPNAPTVDSLASHLMTITRCSWTLGLFNLLPFLPLDGGHLCLLGVESLFGRAAAQQLEVAVLHFGKVIISIISFIVLAYLVNAMVYMM